MSSHNNPKTSSSSHSMQYRATKYNDVTILKQEGKTLGIVLASLIVVYQLLYFKENIFTVILNVLVAAWITVIPGYCALWYWRRDIDLLERMIFGAIIGIALIGVLSYFSGLFGLHVKYHGYVFPPLIIAVGLWLGFRNDSVHATDSDNNLKNPENEDT